eukprot:TRINITY_DN11057_c0_g3_i1.p2 TRINITY_DN11057_c0_g3~~TRINITY_DN11057_c0_g3_i1.p2  ORF type:complete len:289 (+),score=76.53 TRINITY_DN11057_c0_g3_i1:101-967(+)
MPAPAATTSVFTQEPMPFHTGKKVPPSSAAARSRSAEPDASSRFGRKHLDASATQMSLDKQWANTNEDTSHETKHRAMVRGKQANKSRCPWEPNLLSARGAQQAGKKIVAQEPKKASTRGLARCPSADQHPQPHPTKRRTDKEKLGWRMESRPQEWRPMRRVIRSSSADFPAPERTPSARYVNPAFSRLQETTSLQGRNEAANELAAGIRIVRSPSTEPVRKPWATNSPRMKLPAPAQDGKGAVPYDTCANPEAIKSDVGKRSEFRPHNRVFSRQASHQNTHTNIFGS